MVNRKTLYKIKNVLINIAIILTILIGLESILIGYNHHELTDIGDY